MKTFNFSSVSSNHNQHLHRLLKYTDLNFDLVIFYGGFNETIQTYLYSVSLNNNFIEHTLNSSFKPDFLTWHLKVSFEPNVLT